MPRRGPPAPAAHAVRSAHAPAAPDARARATSEAPAPTSAPAPAGRRPRLRARQRARARAGTAGTCGRVDCGRLLESPHSSLLERASRGATVQSRCSRRMSDSASMRRADDPMQNPRVTTADARAPLLSDWIASALGTRAFGMAPASADASFRRYFRITPDAPRARRDDADRDGCAAAAGGLPAVRPRRGAAARRGPECAAHPRAGPRARLPAAHRPRRHDVPVGAGRAQRARAVRRCDRRARAMAARHARGRAAARTTSRCCVASSSCSPSGTSAGTSAQRSTPSERNALDAGLRRPDRRPSRAAAGVRPPRLHAAQPDGDRAQPRRARFPGRGHRPDHLRRRVAVQGRVRQLARGSGARLDDPLLGEGTARADCRSIAISPRSSARSNGWACSAISRCSASSRGIAHRDGKPGYVEDTPRFLAYVRPVAERYRELAPLARLLDRLEAATTYVTALAKPC